MRIKRLAVSVAALAMIATALTVMQPVGAQATETCNGKAATIVGTDGPDRIEGTEGNDVIVGLGDKDVIFGRGGNDTICGGFGNDVIKAGRGNDYVEGNQGNDKLIGGSGKDTQHGGTGKDKNFGGNGPDTLNDSGKVQRNAVNGGKGIDTCNNLNHLTFFAACEKGDVLGSNGDGTDVAFTVDTTDDFLLTRRVIEEDITENFVVELYWEKAPEVNAVFFTVSDANDDTAVSANLTGDSGTERLIASSRPATFDISGASYFEAVVMKRKNLQILGGDVAGTGSWVYRLPDPVPSPAPYEWTHETTESFPFVSLFGAVEDGGTGFIGGDTETGSVTGSTTFGEAHVVAIRQVRGPWVFSIG